MSPHASGPRLSWRLSVLYSESGLSDADRSPIHDPVNYPVPALARDRVPDIFRVMSQDSVVRALQQRLSELDAELLAIAERQARLSTERAQVARLLDLYGIDVVAPANGTVAKLQIPISTAIIDEVRRQEGLSSAEIADRLERRILTGRRDPRRAIASRIYDLTQNGQLRRDDKGRLFLGKNAPGIEELKLRFEGD